ncbi:hypothetical protein [Carnobacterium inhibens]|uniref:hypothetical protein n=1 Tax=Carnobacterium inhibens TaxID=147709 RepID=UPI002041EEE6|nr:hypothetical protein [Carnobacterium inhibens]MCM3511641.1 hypothetical protein [Carnobacterium inhibens]
MVKYSLDDTQSKRLAENMKTVPDKAERLVNETLKAKGMKLMIQEIIRFIPTSNKNKKHAKTSNPLKGTMGNLGFVITTKGGAASNPNSFGYLVFPNEGRGPHNFIAQRFFEKGAETSNEKILTEVIKVLEEANDFKL